MKETRPFSMKDKIGYTLGDLGCCCTEQFRAMYLAIFYTLVLKVNPVHVGILMLTLTNPNIQSTAVGKAKNLIQGINFPFPLFLWLSTSAPIKGSFIASQNFVTSIRIPTCTGLTFNTSV